MKITSLKYSRLSKLRGFENEKLEVHVQVDDDDDPERAFKIIKRWVEVRLALGPNLNPEEKRVMQAEIYPRSKSKPKRRK